MSRNKDVKKAIFLVLIALAVFVAFTLTAQPSFAAAKKPKKVASLDLDVQGTTVELYWTPVKNAKGYQVYRKANSGAFKKVATVKGKKNYFRDKKLSPKKYTYKVRAYTKSGKRTLYGGFCPKESARIAPPCDHVYEHAVLREPGKEVIGIEADVCVYCGKKTNVENVYYQPTEEQVVKDILAMKSVYTEDTLTYACNEVTDRLQKAAFGTATKRHTHFDKDKIRVGDVLHVNNGTHYVIALGFSPNGKVVYCADGGGGYPVSWMSGYPRSCVEEVITCWQDWDK